MSTYRKLHGRAIQAVTTDPTESVAEGQVWYNTTSDTFKSVVSLSAYSSSANMVVAVGSRQGQTVGSQTATLGFGGYVGPPSPPNTTRTDEYNGSGWSIGGALNTERQNIAGCGTTSAAVGNGGELPPTNVSQAT